MIYSAFDHCFCLNVLLLSGPAMEKPFNPEYLSVTDSYTTVTDTLSDEVTPLTSPVMEFPHCPFIALSK